MTRALSIAAVVFVAALAGCDGAPDPEAPDACLRGAVGCPCLDGVCAPEAACVDGVCRICDPPVEGCPCDVERPCDDDSVCDEGRCRARLTCVDVPCAARQRCGAPDGGDARCLPDCEPGFDWYADVGRCEPIADASCVVGAPGSVAVDCAALGRRCEERAEGAACGGCLEGRTDEGGARLDCRRLVRCAVLTCAAVNRECVPAEGEADARCGGCVDGHFEAAEGCLPVRPTCDPERPGSVAAECAAAGRRCVEVGADVRCGDCVEGRVELAGACVDADAVVCTADLQAACAELRRLCEAPGDRRAACGECLPGFAERGGACEAVCDPLGCAEQGRACDDGPSCGACLPTLVPTGPDPADACVVPETCTPETCVGDDICVVVDGLAQCSPRPCPDGEALRVRRNAQGVEIARECVDCGGILCGAVGETGEIWPFAIDGPGDGGPGACVCETLPGFYYDASALRRTEPCDRDGDGWVGVDAAFALGWTGDAVPPRRAPADDAVRANARCGRRAVDRFDLENEYGEVLTIHSCADGLSLDGLCARTPVPLFEPRTTDSDDARVDLPPWIADGRGRALSAREINPLTKACIGGADVNQDGVDDVNEAHAQNPERAVSIDERLGQFAHFVELHAGRFVPPGPTGRACGDDADCGAGEPCIDGACFDAFGRYRITERSRCDTGPGPKGFALGYGPDDSDYWRSCMRNRDARYDGRAVPGAVPPVGMDFAAWSCDRATGTCPTPPPPGDGLSVDGTVPAHGLCDPEIRDRAPDPGVWRGMGHHSQFKCVQVVDEADLRPDQPQRVARDALVNEGVGALQFNRCGVDCPIDDPRCVADCADGCDADPLDGGLTAAARPRLRCAPVDGRALAQGEVGFVAVRHVDSPRVYRRGCIDEWAPGPAADARPWQLLCPGVLAGTAGGASGRGNPTAFGRLICGCSEFYGGTECEIPCNRPQVGGPEANRGQPGCIGTYCTVADGSDLGRLGYWACAGPDGPAPDGPVDFAQDPAEPLIGWAVRNARPRPWVRRAPACEDDDCATGWSAR